MPITDLLDPKDKTLLSADKLLEVFRSKGVDPAKPIISSCGTGVTAAVIDAALTEAGYPVQQRRLYDGSWTEWAQRVKPQDGLIRKVDDEGVNHGS
jgi:thiosulfate/3-mercaptopyruvate sulfurtransferase